jgi:ABC-2 type transport system ATP-binding protein
MFINHGKVVLDAKMDDIPGQFVELLASTDNAVKAQEYKPLYQKDVFGKKVLTFEGVSREQLAGLGELRTPDIADLFVAKVKGEAA